jgi:glycine dehydrogenase subunit 1
VVKCPQSPKEITKKLLERNIIGGLDVSDSVPNGMLFCATEMNTKAEIDALANALGQIAKRS